MAAYLLLILTGLFHFNTSFAVNGGINVTLTSIAICADAYANICKSDGYAEFVIVAYLQTQIIPSIVFKNNKWLQCFYNDPTYEFRPTVSDPFPVLEIQNYTDNIYGVVYLSSSYYEPSNKYTDAYYHYSLYLNKAESLIIPFTLYSISTAITPIVQQSLHVSLEGSQFEGSQGSCTPGIDINLTISCPGPCNQLFPFQSTTVAPPSTTNGTSQSPGKGPGSAEIAAISTLVVILALVTSGAAFCIYRLRKLIPSRSSKELLRSVFGLTTSSVNSSTEVGASYHSPTINAVANNQLYN